LKERFIKKFLIVFTIFFFFFCQGKRVNNSVTPIAQEAPKPLFTPEAIDFQSMISKYWIANGLRLVWARDDNITIPQALEYLDNDYLKRFGKTVDELLPSLRAWMENDGWLAVAFLPNDTDSRSRTDNSKKMTMLQVYNLIKQQVPAEHRVMMLSLAIQLNPNFTYTAQFMEGYGLYNLSKFSLKTQADYTDPVVSIRDAYKLKYLPAFNRYDDDVDYFWKVPGRFLTNVPSYWNMYGTAYDLNEKCQALQVRIRTFFLEQILTLEGVL
jgi:hypothetical protein